MAQCDSAAAAVGAVTGGTPPESAQLKMSGGAAGAPDWADYFQMGVCARCEQLSMRPRRAMIACYACERALCFEHLCQRQTTAAAPAEPEYYCQSCFADRVWLAKAAVAGAVVGGPRPTAVQNVMDVDTTTAPTDPQGSSLGASAPSDVGMSD